MLDLGTEILRNWTNPDLPLWLMQDRAVKQALRYATGGRHIDDRAIQKRIERIGLKRFRRRPIRAMTAHEAKKTSVLQFEGFTYSAGLGNRMHDVERALGFGETHSWIVSGLPGYIAM